MGFDFTTTALLSDIKRRAFIPIAQSTFSDEDLLAIADEELQNGVVPQLMSIREEYFVAYEDTYVDGSYNGFDIPVRAIGAKLRDVTTMQNPGDINNPVEVSLAQLSLDEKPYNNNFTNLITVNAFYLQDNQLYLSPGPSTFGGLSLRMYYFKRPNKLVPVASCAKILSITGNVATVNFIPTGFGTESLFTMTSDIIKAKPGFSTLWMDAEVTVNTTSLEITFPSDPDDYGITVGDYICQQLESPIPQIPVELHPVLAQRAAVRVLESLGDDNNLPAASKKLAEIERNTTKLLSQRVEGAAKKLVNQFGVLSGNPFRRF